MSQSDVICSTVRNGNMASNILAGNLKKDHADANGTLSTMQFDMPCLSTTTSLAINDEVVDKIHGNDEKKRKESDIV
jgi:hypothetical protein